MRNRFLEEAILFQNKGDLKKVACGAKKPNVYF